MRAWKQEERPFLYPFNNITLRWFFLICEHRSCKLSKFDSKKYFLDRFLGKYYWKKLDLNAWASEDISVSLLCIHFIRLAGIKEIIYWERCFNLVVAFAFRTEFFTYFDFAPSYTNILEIKIISYERSQLDSITLSHSSLSDDTMIVRLLLSIGFYFPESPRLGSMSWNITKLYG